MKNLSRILLSLLILLLLVLPAAAADEGNWWEGKAMTDFTYAGLQNVSEATLNSLLSPYLMEPFSNSLFSEINSVLYAQPWLSYVSSEALAEGEEQNLVIRFNITENPMIASVDAVGMDRIGRRTVLGAQEYSSGDFFTPGRLQANADAIKDYYLSHGYRDASVEVSFTEDKEKNTVSILYTISEGKQYKVRDILFEDISGLSADDIQKVMTQKERSFFNGGNFVQANIETDKNAVVALYGREGYPDAKVVSVDVVPTGEED